MDWYRVGFNRHSIWEFTYLCCEYRYAFVGCIIIEPCGVYCQKQGDPKINFLTVSNIFHADNQRFRAVIRRFNYPSDRVVIFHCYVELGLSKFSNLSSADYRTSPG